MDKLLLTDEEMLVAINKYPIYSHDDRWGISDREFHQLLRVVSAQLAKCQKDKEQALKQRDMEWVKALMTQGIVTTSEPSGLVGLADTLEKKEAEALKAQAEEIFEWLRTYGEQIDNNRRYVFDIPMRDWQAKLKSNMEALND